MSEITPPPAQDALAAVKKFWGLSDSGTIGRPLRRSVHRYNSIRQALLHSIYRRNP